jgi:hypothetical protein
VLTRVLITDSVFRGRWIMGDCWVQEKVGNGYYYRATAVATRTGRGLDHSAVGPMGRNVDD